MLDAIPLSGNPYDGNLSEVVLAKSLGLAVKNNVLGFWMSTGTFNASTGETGGVWRNASGQWLTPTFAVYANTSGASGVAMNGVLYDACQGGSLNWWDADAYCKGKNMRLAHSSEARGWSNSGVPSCSVLSWVVNYTGVGASYDYGLWLNTSTSHHQPKWSNGVRCVR